MEQVFTCQVCGKVCKASNGLLAHHDYTRPFKGCQTNSCLGARYEPYEVSCERLKFAIDLYADMLDKRKVRLECRKNDDKDEITHMIQHEISDIDFQITVLQQRLANWNK